MIEMILKKIMGKLIQIIKYPMTIYIISILFTICFLALLGYNSYFKLEFKNNKIEFHTKKD